MHNEAMKASSVRLTLICGLLAASVFGLAQRESAAVHAARRAITAQTAKFSRGYKTKNLKMLESVISSDFVSETAKGQQLSRSQSVAQMQQSLNFIVKLTQVDSKILSIQLVKGVAVLTCDNWLKGTVKLPNGMKSLVSHNKTLEHWVNSKGTWLLQFQRQLPGGKTTLDGKVQPED